MKKQRKAESGKAETDACPRGSVSRAVLNAPRVIAVILAFAAVTCIALADKLTNTVVLGFGPVVLDWHEPPFDAQPKTVLRGAEAEPLPSPHLIEIRKSRLQTFDTNGEVQLTIESPDCVLDVSQRTVNSSGNVEIRSADGKLLNTGEGFLWQQTNSLLIISNSMRTRIRGASTNSFFK